jgi:2-oxoglutarate dehydrogenase E2 component (dihydrolipoamide succinyltransferase)
VSEPSIPAPQPIAASTPGPVETQAAIKILAPEKPAGGRSKVQAYIDAMASGEAFGTAAPVTEAIGQAEIAVQAAEPAVSQWESSSEPAAPAIQVQPGETRVAAMIRELSDAPAPAAVQPEARPAVTPQPEPVAAQPAPQAPAKPAKTEPKAAEGETKGGFMGIMSKAFKALKDIDKPS